MPENIYMLLGLIVIGAIYSLATGAGIAIAMYHYILYLKKRDEDEKVRQEAGKKYWVILVHEWEGYTSGLQKEYYMGTETLYHQPKEGEEICGFGHNEDSGNPPEFFYPIGKIVSVVKLLQLGPGGQEGVIFVEVPTSETETMEHFTKTLVGYESIEINMAE